MKVNFSKKLSFNQKEEHMIANTISSNISCESKNLQTQDAQENLELNDSIQNENPLENDDDSLDLDLEDIVTPIPKVVKEHSFSITPKHLTKSKTNEGKIEVSLIDSPIDSSSNLHSTSNRKSLIPKDPQNLRAQEIFFSSQDPDLSISSQLMILKRALFLDSDSEIIYKKMSDILKRHYMDTKESLILCQSVRQFRKDKAIGFLDADYYLKENTNNGENHNLQDKNNDNNAKIPAIKLYDIQRFYVLELEFVELLDEQLMKFLMEKRFQSAMFCLNELKQTLESLKEDLNYTESNKVNTTFHVETFFVGPSANEEISQLKTTPAAALSVMLSKKQKLSFLQKVNEFTTLISIHEAILNVYLENFDIALEVLNQIENKEENVNIRILRAQIYLKYKNDLKNGRKELEYLCKHHKDLPQVTQLSSYLSEMIQNLRMKGTQLLISKNFEEAIRIFSETIEVLPTDISSYFKRAQCLRYLKFFPAAVRDLFQCINLSGGSNEEAETMLGDSLFEIGYEIMQNANKINEFENLNHQKVEQKKLKRHKNHIDESINEKKQKIKEATDYFTEAIKWHKHYKYYMIRGDCHLQLKEHESALKDYTKARKYSFEAQEVLQRLSSLHNEWGKQLFQEKKYSMAEEELTRSMEIYKFNPIVYLNRCKVRLQLKKQTEAIQDAVATYLLDNSNSEALQLVKQFVPSILQNSTHAQQMYDRIFNSENINELQTQDESQTSNLIHKIPQSPISRPFSAPSSRRPSHISQKSDTSILPNKRNSIQSAKSRISLKSKSSNISNISTISNDQSTIAIMEENEINLKSSRPLTSHRNRRSVSRMLQYSDISNQNSSRSVRILSAKSSSKSKTQSFNDTLNSQLSKKLERSDLYINESLIETPRQYESSMKSSSNLSPSANRSNRKIEAIQKMRDKKQKPEIPAPEVLKTKRLSEFTHRPMIFSPSSSSHVDGKVHIYF